MKKKFKHNDLLLAIQEESLEWTSAEDFLLKLNHSNFVYQASSSVRSFSWLGFFQEEQLRLVDSGVEKLDSSSQSFVHVADSGNFIEWIQSHFMLVNARREKFDMLPSLFFILNYDFAFKHPHLHLAPSKHKQETVIAEARILDPILIWDEKNKKFKILSSGLNFAHENCQELARQRIIEAKKNVEKTKSIEKTFQKRASFNEVFDAESEQSSLSAAQYIQQVERAQASMAEGELYQINLAKKISYKLKNKNLLKAYFLNQIQSKKPQHAYYIEMKHKQILSFSPELLCEKKQNRVISQPIKGSREKTNDAQENKQKLESLKHSQKEKAELLMITDLIRNDLSPCSQLGSVTVSELCAIQEHPYLYHQYSSIQSLFDPQHHPLDLLLSLFPGGSITGTPKKKAIEKIDELEPCARGLFSGSLGWLDMQGDMQFNIAIRTLEILNEEACFGVGSGIVLDSIAREEEAETCLKLKVLT